MEQNVTDIDPEKAIEQFIEKALSHFEAKRYQNALLYCEKALKIDKYCVRAYHGKGLCLIYLNRLEAAADFFCDLLEFRPNDYKAHTRLGDICRLQKRYV